MDIDMTDLDSIKTPEQLAELHAEKYKKILIIIDMYINLAAGTRSQFLCVLLGLKRGIQAIIKDQNDTTSN
jgi:hypothetical protein